MARSQRLTLREHEVATWPSGWDVVAFERYLRGIWRSRRMDEPSADAEQPFFRFNHKGQIRAQNFVGTVSWKGLEISVYPKVMRDDAELWPHLSHWLNYSNRVQFSMSEVATRPRNVDAFLEASMWLFALTARDLVDSLPFREYDVRIETLGVVRGQMQYSPWLDRQYSKGAPHRFVVEHAPLDADNRLNRLIKFVARALRLLSRRAATIQVLDSVIQLLSEVSDAHMTAADCDQVALNRMFLAYQPVVDLARFFLESMDVDSTSGGARNWCFLFPMERVFEEFIAGFLVKQFPECRVDIQTSRPLSLEGAFKLRPDLLISTENGERIILDTKYKLCQLGLPNSGVSPADAYQLLAYALRWESSHAGLVYPQPWNSGLNDGFSYTVENGGNPMRFFAVSVPFVFADLDRADDELVAALRPFLSGSA